MGAPAQAYWVKRIDNSRLRRERDPDYFHETGVLVSGTLACLAIILLCAWLQFEFIHTGYRLEETRARYEKVLEWNRNLRLEQAALLDPMRIDVLARSRLGMTEPAAHELTPLGSAPPASSAELARVPAQARPEKQSSLTD